MNKEIIFGIICIVSKAFHKPERMYGHCAPPVYITVWVVWAYFGGHPKFGPSILSIYLEVFLINPYTHGHVAPENLVGGSSMIGFPFVIADPEHEGDMPGIKSGY